MDGAIHFHQPAPGLRRPLLLVGLAGPNGSGAAAVVAHLREQWPSEPLAAIDPDPFYDFTVLRPQVRTTKRGRVIEWPEIRFDVVSPPAAGRDFVLLTAHEPHLRWRQFADAIAEVASTLGVAQAVVLSTFAGGVPHTRPAPVQLFGPAEGLAEIFELPQQPSRYEGPAWFSMVLGERLRERGLEVGTLNAIAPFYVGLDPSPHAAYSLLRRIDQAFSLQLDFGDLDQQLAAVNAQADQAVSRTAELRRLVENLETQQDSLGAQAPPVEPAAELPEPDDVVRSVERLLARDTRDGGPERRGAAHGVD